MTPFKGEYRLRWGVITRGARHWSAKSRRKRWRKAYLVIWPITQASERRWRNGRAAAEIYSITLPREADLISHDEDDWR